MRAAAAVVLVVLAACARPTVAPMALVDAPAAPAAPHRPQPSATATLANGFLTVETWVPDAPAGPKPAVISLVDDLREPLLDLGMVVVAFRLHWELLRAFASKAPPPAPGDRPAGQWLLASPSSRTVGRGFFGLIHTNAEWAVPRVVDYLGGLPDVDAARIGIVGNSTTGFTALQAVGVEPRLAAAAVLFACGDYRCFLRRSSLGMAGQPLELAPDYAADLDAHDPLRHPARWVHAAVLMVNASDDLAIPLPCVEATAHALERAYARAGRAGRYRLTVVPGGHGLGNAARLDALAWLYLWLVMPPAP
jgi:hypothetical protein